MMGGCASSSAAALCLSRLPISSSSSSCFLRKNGTALIPLRGSSSLLSLSGSHPPYPPLLPSPSPSTAPSPSSLSSRLFCASLSASVLHVKRHDEFKSNPNSPDDVDDGFQQEEQEEEESSSSAVALEVKGEEEEQQQQEQENQQQVEKLEVPKLSVKEKKELSSFAHRLGKKLKSQQIGKSGVTPSLATSFIETLEANELLKIKIHGSCAGELVDVIKQLEEATGSVAVDQIGRSVIVYRPSLSKMKKREAANLRKPKEYPTSGAQKKVQAPRASGEGRRQPRQV